MTRRPCAVGCGEQLADTVFEPDIAHARRARYGGLFLSLGTNRGYQIVRAVESPEPDRLRLKAMPWCRHSGVRGWAQRSGHGLSYAAAHFDFNEQRCHVPPFEGGGGFHGGHVLYMWDPGASVHVVSAHGYENRPRVQAMMASLIRRLR